MAARVKADTATLPRAIRGLNVAQRVAELVGRDVVKLRKPALLEAASKAAGGLTDFGDERFHAGLDRLLESVEEGNRLNAFGRLVLKGQITNLLTQRLLMTAHLRAHPEILDEPIERPIFIVGAPRTGTTITHHLLSQDERFRFPYTWECDELHPPADPATVHTDPRIERSQKGLDQLLRFVPGLDAAHPIGALEAQECIMLHAYEFHSIAFLTLYDAQAYDRWLVDQDVTWVYERERLMLQYLQSGGLRPTEGWLLKAPPHMEQLDAILEVFPDARFVTTYREPTEIVASGCSLVSQPSRVVERAHDRKQLGRYAEWRLGRMLERNVEQRERWAHLADRFVDFPMQRVVQDPLTCVAEIYERFGIELPGTVRDRMQAFVERRRQRRPHVYDPAEYGLDLRAMWPRFDRYRELYGIESTPP